MTRKQCLDILDLPNDASADDIKQAYRQLAQVWHPDRFPNNPALQRKANAKLAEINEAYNTLIEGRATPDPQNNSAQTNAGNPNPPPEPTVAYRDAEVRYLGSDPRLKMPTVGMFVAGDVALVEISGEGMSLVTFNNDGAIGAMWYPAPLLMAMAEGQNRWVQRGSSVAWPSDVDEAIPPDWLQFYFVDPEGILDHLIVVNLKFRNDYYAQLFRNRIRAAVPFVAADAANTSSRSMKVPAPPAVPFNSSQAGWEVADYASWFLFGLVGGTVGAIMLPFWIAVPISLTASGMLVNHLRAQSSAPTAPTSPPPRPAPPPPPPKPSPPPPPPPPPQPSQRNTVRESEIDQRLMFGCMSVVIVVILLFGVFMALFPDRGDNASPPIVPASPSGTTNSAFPPAADVQIRTRQTVPLAQSPYHARVTYRKGDTTISGFVEVAKLAADDTKWRNGDSVIMRFDRNVKSDDGDYAGTIPGGTVGVLYDITSNGFRVKFPLPSPLTYVYVKHWHIRHTHEAERLEKGSRAVVAAKELPLLDTEGRTISTLQGGYEVVVEAIGSGTQ